MENPVKKYPKCLSEHDHCVVDLYLPELTTSVDGCFFCPYIKKEEKENSSINIKVLFTLLFFD